MIVGKMLAAAASELMAASQTIVCACMGAPLRAAQALPSFLRGPAFQSPSSDHSNKSEAPAAARD